MTRSGPRSEAAAADGAAILVPAAPPVQRTPWRAGRSILPPPESSPVPAAVAWSGVRMGEWVLEGGWFADVHPHDEVTYLLDGELVVQVDAVSHTLSPGDALLVPAGTAARYEAAGRAHILFVYGPNPDGRASPPPSEGPRDPT